MKKRKQNFIRMLCLILAILMIGGAATTLLMYLFYGLL